MITLRLAEPWEARPVLCAARRRPRGKVRCIRPALHEHAHAGYPCGRWYFW